jgi:hypothetical protein
MCASVVSMQVHSGSYIAPTIIRSCVRIFTAWGGEFNWSMNSTCMTGATCIHIHVHCPLSRTRLTAWPMARTKAHRRGCMTCRWVRITARRSGMTHLRCVHQRGTGTKAGRSPRGEYSEGHHVHNEREGKDYCPCRAIQYYPIDIVNR